MTAPDIIVLILIGGGAIFGFLRGFVQEVLSLGVWVLAIIVIRFFHEPVTHRLLEPIGDASGAAILAFVGLFLATYIVGKWTANFIGGKSRKSLLGPIDRVLGFGFGALKGLLIASLLYLLIILGYSTIYGDEAERPEWMINARSYPLLNASGEALVQFVKEQRAKRENSDAPNAEDDIRPQFESLEPQKIAPEK